MSFKKNLNKKTIILLGNAGVGKTAMVKRLLGDLFDPNTSVTEGTQNSQIKGLKVPSIYDFGGQEIYTGDAKKEIYKMSPSVILIAIDARDGNSIETINHWCSIAHQSQNGEDVNKFLIITRCDVAPYTAHNERLISEKFDFLKIIRTSAETGEGVQELRSAVNNVFPPDDDHSEVSAIVKAMSDQLCELIAKNPQALREIEWRDLERLLSRALEGLGFQVELTRPAKDGGKDIVVNCRIEKKTYYIEIKHWREKRPGLSPIEDFLELNARKETDGGLFLSSSGFTRPVYAQVRKLSKQKLRLGEQEKIVSLCVHFTKKRDGIWYKTKPLPDLLFEETL